MTWRSLTLKAKPSGGSRVRPIYRGDRAISGMLAVLLIAAFLFGGSARGDVQSLALLRPIAAAALGFALFTISPVELSRDGPLYAFFGACFLLILLQLVPLPPTLWTGLPGRELVAQVAKVAGSEQPWLPLSLVPAQTWNSFFALLVPAAVMALGLRCTASAHRILLHLVLALGCISAVVGLFQAIDPVGEGLRFYRIYSTGSATGLFANRNHQAIFLTTMFPCLAVAAGQARAGRDGRLIRFLGAGIGALLVPLILVTGSRAGIALMLVALLTIPWLYRPRTGTDVAGALRNKAFGTKTLYSVIALSFAALVTASVWAGRDTALGRLMSVDNEQSLRTQSLPVLFSLIRTYGPVGSGFGSFANVYRVAEPASLLSPVYFNQAHDDPLQLLIEGGLPAGILLAIGLAFWTRALIACATAQVKDVEKACFVRLGVVVIGLLGLGSLFDYPVRTPALAAVLALGGAWMSMYRSRTGDGKALADRPVLN